MEVSSEFKAEKEEITDINTSNLSLSIYHQNDPVSVSQPTKLKINFEFLNSNTNELQENLKLQGPAQADETSRSQPMNLIQEFNCDEDSININRMGLRAEDPSIRLSSNQNQKPFPKKDTQISDYKAIKRRVLEKRVSEVDCIKETSKTNENSLYNRIKSSESRSGTPQQIVKKQKACNLSKPIKLTVSKKESKSSINAISYINNTHKKGRSANQAKHESANRIVDANKFALHDIGNLTYEAAKMSQLVNPSLEEPFDVRTAKDVKQRQEKSEKIKAKIQKFTPKITDNQKIETFNRLIKDANRRIEAHDSKESLINKISSTSKIKKVSKEEWQKTYNNR